MVDLELYDALCLDWAPLAEEVAAIKPTWRPIWTGPFKELRLPGCGPRHAAEAERARRENLTRETLPAGGAAPRGRGASPQRRPAPAAPVAPAAGKNHGRLRTGAPAAAHPPAGGGAAGGRLRGAARERAGLRQSRQREDALLCAIGLELSRQGRPVLFTSCGLLVQELLAAKAELRLARSLRQAWAHSRRSSSTTSVTCSRAARRWRCCSRCWPTATNVAA